MNHKFDDMLDRAADVLLGLALFVVEKTEEFLDNLDKKD